jgi:DNA-3-methyladenine glycosylase II
VKPSDKETARRFEIRTPGRYSLASSVRFLEGFAPAAYEGDGTDRLRLAFVADGFAERGEKVAGVRVNQEGNTVFGEVFGEAEVGVVRDQVSRILSLDVDGDGFAEVGERDPVVGALQERYPGLRPVLFNSPYEAAAWAIIGNRVRIVQAARIKARMAAELGPSVEVSGRREHAFPGPSRLARLEGFPGLSARKVGYLRRLAAEAAEGELEAGYLRSLPAEEALARLKELPGIGDFSAELILLRGAGATDLLPVNEARLRRAVAKAYGLEEPPTTGRLERIAEAWRPYRTWVSLHLRTMLEDETGEISGLRRK